jgi:3-hydroxymyristoyl/3-hydroxydecanoyl-(acyl carrier protein) dehydratase
MASNPVDLQTPSMIVSEEEVFITDHYNFRPIAPGIDIDVFLKPLMQVMETLWKHGVKMWDELAKITSHAKPSFLLPSLTAQDSFPF